MKNWRFLVVFTLLVAIGVFVYQNQELKNGASVISNSANEELKYPNSNPPPSVVAPKTEAPSNRSMSLEDFMLKGDFAAALKLLNEKSEEKRDMLWQRNMAEVLDGLGRASEALKHLAVIEKAGLEDKEVAAFFWYKAHLLSSAGKNKDSNQSLCAIFEQYPDSREAINAARELRSRWKNWEKQSDNKPDLRKLNLVLTFLMEKAQDKEEEDQLIKDLNEVNQALFFSSESVPDLVQFYSVQSGDTLGSIASRHKIYADRVQRVNGLPDRNRIRQGQSLRMIMGPSKVVVDRRKFRLYLYINDYFFKAYSVGIGKDGRTPTLKTKITGLAPNPSYTDPESGKMYPFPTTAEGRKKNPIGTRWVRIQGNRGLGIHGTWEPDSVGKASSNGCIRLKNEDVEDLYDYLMEGDTVSIL